MYYLLIFFKNPVGRICFKIKSHIKENVQYPKSIMKYLNAIWFFDFFHYLSIGIVLHYIVCSLPLHNVVKIN